MSEPGGAGGSGRHYCIDWNYPEQAAWTTIQLWIDQLTDLRATSVKGKKETDWEIRLYKFMQEQPVERLEAYLRERKIGAGPRGLTPKRQVVRRLGWDVP